MSKTDGPNAAEDHQEHTETGETLQLSVWKEQLAYMNNRQLEEELIHRATEGKTAHVRAVVDFARDGKRSIGTRVNNLLRRKFNIAAQDNNAMRAAAERGHIETMETLIKLGAPVDGRYHGPLAAACEKGRIAVVNFLLGKGANVKIGDDYIIARAAINGNIDVAKILIEHGADVTGNESSPLRHAAEAGHTDMVKLLLEHGADACAWDSEALRRAAAKGHAEIVNILIEHGADIHADKEAALRSAAFHGHTEICKKLLSEGASIEVARYGGLKGEGLNYIRRLHIEMFGGWEVMDEKTVAETKLNRNGLCITRVFNFEANQVLTTMTTPDLQQPSNPVITNFADIENQNVVELARSKLPGAKQGLKVINGGLK